MTDIIINRLENYVLVYNSCYYNGLLEWKFGIYLLIDLFYRIYFLYFIAHSMGICLRTLNFPPLQTGSFMRFGTCIKRIHFLIGMMKRQRRTTKYKVAPSSILYSHFVVDPSFSTYNTLIPSVLLCMYVLVFFNL